MQLERLAAIVHQMRPSANGSSWQACVDCKRDAEMLMSQGVRVVDVDTLAAALEATFPPPESYDKWLDMVERSYESDAGTILAALDAE